MISFTLVVSSLLCSQFKYIVDIECLDYVNLKSIVLKLEEQCISMGLIYMYLGRLNDRHHYCGAL